MWYALGYYNESGEKKELAIAYNKEEVKKYYDSLRCRFKDCHIWVEEVRSVDVEHEL